MQTCQRWRRRIARLAEQSPEMGFTSLTPPNRYRLAERSLSSHSQEWGSRRRRSDCEGVRGEPGGKPPGFAPTSEIGDLPGSARPTEAHSEMLGHGDSTDRALFSRKWATFEEKVLQRAIVMLLEPIYEPDFHDGSYGFRPKRSPHQAMDALWKETTRIGGGWILEVDLRKFFDTLDHSHLRDFVSHRIRDGVVRRLIGKWLKAGVMEDGNISYPESGSPQGGCISPILANIYLHYVLDMWFEETVKPQLPGSVKLIRFADDFVIVFSNRDAALQVKEMLTERFAEYGLTVHPDKTRLVDFRHPSHSGRKRDGNSKPDTFDLLGFTHYWGKSRKGNWTVKKKTMSKRLTRSVRSIYQWCRKYRHLPVHEQWRKLCQKVRGHYAYYGVTGNGRMLNNFLHEVRRVWRKWLNRRNRERKMTWEKFGRLGKRYPLPLPKIYYSGST